MYKIIPTRDEISINKEEHCGAAKIDKVKTVSAKAYIQQEKELSWDEVLEYAACKSPEDREWVEKVKEMLKNPYIPYEAKNSMIEALRPKAVDMWNILENSPIPSTDKEKIKSQSYASNTDQNIKIEGTGNVIIDMLAEDTSLGLTKEKKETITYIANILLEEGYEPAFIAGVLANVLAEGSFGKFESSAYISNPSAEPDYLKHMDKYYNYRTEFSGKNIMEVDVEKTKKLLDALVSEDRNNDGKIDSQKGSFGFGAVQWTWGRTFGVIDCYIEVCGLQSFPTLEQCQKAEGLFMVRELNGDYYNKKVYQKWKSQYSNSNSLDAAYGAGSIVCLEYEKPKNMNEKAIDRANNAKKIYNVIMGTN